MADEFVYQPRSNEDWELRVNQSGGNYQRFTKEEYRGFVPQRGENHIRILPPSNRWQGARHYGLDVFVHYGIGPSKASVVCLELGAPQIGIGGQLCPICQARNQALAINDEKLALDLRATKRVLMFVVDRKDPQKGVLLFACPFTLDKLITRIAQNRSNATFYFIDRPNDGYDVYFDREGEGMTSKYQIATLAQKPSSIDKRFVDWANTHPLPEVLVLRDYDEVKRLYEGRGHDEEEETSSARDYEEPPRNTTRHGTTEEHGEYRPRSGRDETPDSDEVEDDQPVERSSRIARPRSASSNGGNIPFDGPYRSAPQPEPRPEPRQQPSTKGSTRADQVGQRFANPDDVRARFLKRK